MLRKLMIAAAAIGSCLTATAPAFAYSDDFVDGIAYAIMVYDNTCKDPVALSSSTFRFMSKLGDSMTLGEMNHFKDLMRQSKDLFGDQNGHLAGVVYCHGFARP